MAEVSASVIVPTFNQADALSIVMRAFEAQRVDEPWELIVVDDGSDDSTERVIALHATQDRIKAIRIPHAGRSVARNTGIAAARGRVLIFCDGDRAPEPGFVAAHLRRHRRSGRLVVIGDISEFYISRLSERVEELADDAAEGFPRNRSTARRPAYVRAVLQMFDQSGATKFAMPWISFFSGNASLDASLMPRFDPEFDSWGFEHFELGLRMYNGAATFEFENAARNYHFAHARPRDFYDRMLQASFVTFQRKHPVEEVELLWPFLHGELSLQDFHNRICGRRGLAPVDAADSVVYRQRQVPRANRAG